MKLLKSIFKIRIGYSATNIFILLIAISALIAPVVPAALNARTHDGGTSQSFGEEEGNGVTDWNNDVNLALIDSGATGFGEQADSIVDGFQGEEEAEGVENNSDGNIKSVDAWVNPDQATDISLQYGGREIRLHVPSGAVDGEVLMQIVDHGMQGSIGGGSLGVIELHAFPVDDCDGAGEVNTADEVKNFKEGLTISIRHTPEELLGLNLETLKLYCLDEDTRQWLPVPDSEFDPSANTLTATIDHFSYYGENADPVIHGPGKIMAFQTDLQSGSAIYSYPIEVPPGAGGFQPDIRLIYNSAGVDEMRNKMDVGSWVGIGWSLGLGSVSYDQKLNEYYLSLDGYTYYSLVSDIQGSYHTVPESYLNVTRKGKQWDVYDTAGTYYRFGNTTDSVRYNNYDKVYYRWDLNLIYEAHTGNEINIDYIQDISKGNCRAAYPSRITYNNNHVSINFSSSSIRPDVPSTYLIAETSRLDSINISVDGSLVRKYVFSYNTLPCYQSTNYAGAYYAGRHTLSSVQEIGSDGLSMLPATSFAYADRIISHYDPDELKYIGNPGNPALLQWPYLVSATNGYGAAVTYNYNESPVCWGKVGDTDEQVDMENVGVLRSVWCSPGGDIFTASDDGEIFHNDGLSWTKMNTDLSQVGNSSCPYINDFWGRYPYDVFAVGNQGMICHYDGISWSYMNSPTSVDLIGVRGISYRNVLAIGSNCAVLLYNGSSWNEMYSGTTQDVCGVWIHGSNNGDICAFAVGKDGTILRCRNYAWSNMNSGTNRDLKGVWGSAANNLFAVGDGGTILRYNGTWNQMASGTTQDLLAVWGSSSTDVFAVGRGNTALHYDGSKWTNMNLGESNPDFSPYDIYGNSRNDVYAVGLNQSSGEALMLHYDGMSWSAVNNEAMPVFTAMAGVHVNNRWSNNSVYAASADGRVFRYNGSYWSDMVSDNSKVLWDISSAPGSSSIPQIIAVGAGGTALQYRSLNWRKDATNISQELRGVLTIGSGNSVQSIAVGLGGKILRYGGLVNGDKWTVMNSGTTQDLHGVWWDPMRGYTFAVGVNGTILRLEGVRWLPMSSSTAYDLYGVWGTNSSNMFAVGDGGTILRYNGKVWSRMESGTTEIVFTRVRGMDTYNVFAVGYPDALYHYNGFGWAAMNSGTHNATLLDSRIHDTVYISGVADTGEGIFLKYPFVENLWTRNVVTSMSMDPGIGPRQSYRYDYTGEPQYFHRGPGPHAWDDEFRGYSQVRATDSEGNYTEHYFWTTGNGDAEILTGREHRTESYDSSGQLLFKKELTWAYAFKDGQSASPGSGLAGYWQCDENSGQTASDSSGLGNNGTLGPTEDYEDSDSAWTSGGRYQPALSYDGVDDYLNIGNGSSLNLTANFSIEAWVKLDSLSTKDCIIASGVGTNNSSYYHQWVLYIDNSDFDNRVCFEMGLSTNKGLFFNLSGDYTNVNQGIRSNASIKDSSWHHIAVTFNRIPGSSSSSYQGRIYIDGQKRAERTQSWGNTVTPVNTGVMDRRIGSRSAGGDYFHGTIDDVRVYSRVLSLQEIQQHATCSAPFIYLAEQSEVIGSVTSRTRYVYDEYGNLVTTHIDGDLSTADDDATIHRVFCPNISANILSKPARERIYATITDDTGGDSLRSETVYYYDGNNADFTAPPSVGEPTRIETKFSDGSSASSYFTYDSYGNVLTEQDPNGNVWRTTYETTYHIFPHIIYGPIAGQSESYVFDPKTGNLLSRTDVNNQSTSYEYDVFGRIIKVLRPGDTNESPSAEYQYNNWGTLGHQHLKTLVKINTSDYLWSSQYFNGFGRVIQTQSTGETGQTVIDSTTLYDSRGLAAKAYVPQVLNSSLVDGYMAPESGWEYSSSVYDALGRVVSTTAADGTTASIDYSIPLQQTVTNPSGNKRIYYYDAFGRLMQVDELDDSDVLYAATAYSYDTKGNLVQVEDDAGNVTTMSYDWLGRKTAMFDPDMGNWSYQYDANGNLISQTDARGQTVTLIYDALNRITAKLYPEGSGMIDVSYGYDGTEGGNYGVGLLTGMTDAAGTSSYTYDVRGRLIQESKTIDGADYTTGFSYDAGDRLSSVTYPTGEKVIQTYNIRGLPDTLSGGAAGVLVTDTTYNQLGQITRINLGNGAYNTYAYYGLGAGAPPGYWGRLWQITTCNVSDTLRDIRHTWDANGNLVERYDAIAGATETFMYDFLDRLTSVSGAYSQTFTYNEIGNILTMDGVNYTYGPKPHAVAEVGNTSYVYDANGNMVARGGQTITWDIANMPVAVTDDGNTSTFVYDGNGNRVKKNEGGQINIYVNQYYEKNLTTGEVISHYYLGSKEVAYNNSDGLRYVHQDHLTGTSLATDSTGAIIALIDYYPYGTTRSQSGNLDTDKLFTGQRLDDTGLYYYNARYYDATIGRFISADPAPPDAATPQTLNRYAYAANNPLKFIDPIGLDIVLVAGTSQMTIGDMLNSWGDFISGLGEYTIDQHGNYWIDDQRLVLVPDMTNENMGLVLVGYERLDLEKRVYKLVSMLWDANSNQTCRPLQDLKFFGFSEGAATLVEFFNSIASGSITLPNGMRSEIEACVLMEFPNWCIYNEGTLPDANGLPNKFPNVHFYDMWNRASLASGVPLTGSGWILKSYDSRSFWEQVGQVIVGPGAGIIWSGASQPKYHNDIIRNSKPIGWCNEIAHGIYD